MSGAQIVESGGNTGIELDELLLDDDDEEEDAAFSVLEEEELNADGTFSFSFSSGTDGRDAGGKATRKDGLARRTSTARSSPSVRLQKHRHEPAPPASAPSNSRASSSDTSISQSADDRTEFSKKMYRF